MNGEKLNNYIYDSLNNSSSLAKNLSNDSNIEFRDMYFKIKEHINDFLGGYKENRFLTLAGLRGVGKTTILLQIYNYLRHEKNISKDRILYISADELTDFLGNNLYEAINVFIEEVHGTSPVILDEELFIFIDESHYDKNWSKAGKVFYDKTENIFFIFTGSSALNFEIKVDAVRRIKKESIFPLSFHEYNTLKNKINWIEDYEKTINDIIFRNKGIDKGRKKENEMKKRLLNLNSLTKKEWENYLLCGGFPYGLNMLNDEFYRRTFSMINKIIEKDIFSLKSFNTDTKSTISQIITYIALQSPGGTSNKKLAMALSKSQKQIREILHILEKTHLIFTVKPYGSGSKQIRKPWKYYFLSPSITSSVRYKFGNFNKNDRQFLGLLAENLVASYLFKVKESGNQYMNLFYDPLKNGVDFLIDTGDKTIPIEVGIGKKRKKQIIKAMNHYKADYGIIISNTTARIKKEDNIIHIPLMSIP